jgi:hypothetical protein
MENAGLFYGRLEYFTAVWYILMAIWKCHGNSVYIFSLVLVNIVSRKIWQTPMSARI